MGTEDNRVDQQVCRSCTSRVVLAIVRLAVLQPHDLGEVALKTGALV